MGLFWDLMQQSQLSSQDQRTQTVENRVQRLERELTETRALLHKLITVLERERRKDLDGDGRVGRGFPVLPGGFPVATDATREDCRSAF